MLDYYYYAGAGVVRLGVVLCKGLVRGDGGVPEPDHSPPPHPGSRLLRSQQSSGSDCPTSRAAAWQLQSAPAAFSHKLPHLFSQRTRNPPTAEATCSGPFRDPCHGAGLGCSCTLFSTCFAAAAISADSCTGTGAACSCRRSRHLRLRRGGPSKAYNVQAAGKTWAVCFGLPMTLFDPRTIDWEKLKQKRLCKSFSL